MRCNQRFFGQEHFEKGTAERDFCASLQALKPAMSQYGFAMRDRLPPLPSDVGARGFWLPSSRPIPKRFRQRWG